MFPKFFRPANPVEDLWLSSVHEVILIFSIHSEICDFIFEMIWVVKAGLFYDPLRISS